ARIDRLEQLDALRGFHGTGTWRDGTPLPSRTEARAMVDTRRRNRNPGHGGNGFPMRRAPARSPGGSRSGRGPQGGFFLARGLALAAKGRHPGAHPSCPFSGSSLMFGIPLLDLSWLIAALLAAGAVTGLLAGVFGVGGGAVAVPI